MGCLSLGFGVVKVTAQDLSPRVKPGGDTADLLLDKGDRAGERPVLKASDV